MTTFDAKCKFCHKALKLKLDDAYAQAGDPLKLVQLAACNRCADYYAARRLLFEKIRKNCLTLFSGTVSKEDKPKMREIIVALIKRYMRSLAEFRGAPIPDWDEQLIDNIMAQPGNYSDVVERIPKMLEAPKLI